MGHFVLLRLQHHAKTKVSKMAKYTFLTHICAPNMVEWGFPEKILQNAVQTRWS